MNYVMACVSLLQKSIGEFSLKARGRAIVKAVDSVELLKRSFPEGLKIKSIEIGTEEVDRQEVKRKISTIEITVKRTGKK